MGPSCVYTCLNICNPFTIFINSKVMLVSLFTLFFGTPCIILTLKTENKVFLTKNCSSVRNNIMHILDGGLDWVILLHLSGGLVLRFYLNTFEDQTEIVSTHAVSDTNLINMQTTCCKLFDCLITHTTVPLC